MELRHCNFYELEISIIGSILEMRLSKKVKKMSEIKYIFVGCLLLLIVGCNATTTTDEDKSLAETYVTRTDIDGSGSDFDESIAPQISGVAKSQ